MDDRLFAAGRHYPQGVWSMDADIHSPDRAGSFAEPMVWIVARDAGYAASLSDLLREHESFRRTRVIRSCEEAIDVLRANTHPSVILVDICGTCSKKLEAIAQMRGLSPASQIIVLASSDDEDTIIQSICAGATGYLLRETAPQSVIRAIQDILTGGTPMEPVVAHKVLSIVSHLAHQKHDYCLTEREKDVLRLIAEGCAKKEIAEALFISYFTVDTHLKNIYEKMHVHSQGAAISKAFKERLLYML
jgi:DNA-binding NarL/FixJ family response regulator